MEALKAWIEASKAWLEAPEAWQEVPDASHPILGGIFPKLDWCVNFFQSIPCVFHGENVDFDRS